MFDYHMHTTVSFDGKGLAPDMVRAAEQAGLKEICFTDHRDYQLGNNPTAMVFDLNNYRKTYDRLSSPSLKIRRGMEFGMKPHNQDQFSRDARSYPFDFILGSVHFVDEVDVYFPDYWKGKTVFEAERRFLEETLTCVKAHDQFDVLAHLNFLSKAPCNPGHTPLLYSEHREIVDEILKTLAEKGKGLELNTSGMDRCGSFLPSEDFFRRFKELGGEIVTVGSDAHAPDRVGQYTREAVNILGDIFGYVCTFAERKPIFHKI